MYWASTIDREDWNIQTKKGHSGMMVLYPNATSAVDCGFPSKYSESEQSGASR